MLRDEIQTLNDLKKRYLKGRTTKGEEGEVDPTSAGAPVESQQRGARPG